MGHLTMALYLHNIRERYQSANKQEKGHILDEFCQTSGRHRKSAIRLLNHQPVPGGGHRRQGTTACLFEGALNGSTQPHLVGNGSTVW